MSMISKPADSNWTDDQWKAISLHNENLLIAAAAGSGKTAVLVERIIRRISAEQDAIDVDRLLVATFTKAAADEMRHRIREALEQKLLQDPGSQHLRRQLALIHRASITTLHSFCLEVVKRYFQVIPIDPGFRIGNETEMEMMRQDALEELFENYYADSEENSDFWKLVDAYSGERNDDGLYKLVLELYDYSRSHPWPEHWLMEMAEAFNLRDESVENQTSSEDRLSAEEHLEFNNIWTQSLLIDIRLELTGALGLLNEAVQLCGQPGGPDAYLENLNDDLVLIEHLYDIAHDTTHEHTWADLYQAFLTVDFSRLKAAKGDEIDKEIQERVKSLRETVKKQLLGLKEECFTRPPEIFIEELSNMAPLMKTLVQIVIDFSAHYKESKTVKGLVDFSDLEHYCLQILRQPDSKPGELLPSQAALDYQNQFIEVLLDEYQDTNRVQESIVSLISKQSPGNRFMVGDVKQSIYRFRLAEPALFLQKYKSYKNDEGELNSEGDGRRIDLARNFRSRREVVDGVNYIFKQMMQEAVGEIAYDKKAELVTGAAYPELPKSDLSQDPMNCSIEMMLIDRTLSVHDEDSGDEYEDSGENSTMEDINGAAQQSDEASLEDAKELETVQMEGRLIAAQIKRLMGTEGMPFQVHDLKAGGNRPMTYRDIVILLRATQQWAPVMMEELRQAGIPCYADLNTGYFSAGEIEIVLALLRVVDNPLQDIPLAALLRSPIYQLTAEELSQIRIGSRGTSFYEAVLAFVKSSETEHAGLRTKLELFTAQLEDWRNEARQGSLADLLWRIYRETGYYDLVGGMPGGSQRQANLRALYDRARQYESTSFRGLFRFLRFIERMRDSGGDLGTARALGEQEDVVRIMSIHKSKGLEFPIVFVAGLAKMFNQQDLKGNFLMHKQLGFGPRYVDMDLRVSYPTLPSIAIRRRMRMEMLAEEMRVLYVALTRAKEKLFLLGTVKKLDKLLQNWSSHMENPEWHLSDYTLAKANSYLDWLGPALIRHPQAAPLRDRANIIDRRAGFMADEASKWNVSIIPADGFAQAASSVEEREESILNAISYAEPIPHEPTGYQSELIHKLLWQYPYVQATAYFSKTSVSEMKRMEGAARMQQQVDEYDSGYSGYESAAMNPFGIVDQYGAPMQSNSTKESTSATAKGSQNALLRRPQFMEEKKLTAAERGTVYHTVMQHIPLESLLLGNKDKALIKSIIEQTLEQMIENKHITSEQKNVIDVKVIESFFTSEIGVKLLQSKHVNREVPFSYGLPAKDVYPDTDDKTADEIIMIQGVIDCLFESVEGLVLVDYKTDAVSDSHKVEEISERYRLQIDLYTRAIEGIWKRPVIGKYLFLFDGSHVVKM